MLNTHRPIVQFVLILVACSAAIELFGCQSASVAPSASAPAVSASDLDRLTGPIWTGTLTYRDYQTDKQTSIDSTLEVVKLPGLAQVGNDFADAGAIQGWEFRISYPREPKANSTSTVKISNGGTRLDDEAVTERLTLPNNALRLTTEENGTDNDKPALFRHIYTISDHSFTITKLVKPVGAEDFFERNTYRWTR